MKVVLFSRVPRWYSFKNERLARRLTADGHEVAGVIVEVTSTLDSLREWRKKLGADVFLKKVAQKVLGKKTVPASTGAIKLPEASPAVYFVKSHNSPECVEILNKIAPDLIVLRGCGIIKKEVLSIPKIGVINPHYAKLPDFRGMDVTEWSVLCGADVAVSVHTVNEGVDTGVVLRTETIKPTRIDTVGSLRDKSATLVVDLLAAAVSDFANGKEFPIVESTEPGGSQFFQMHERLKRLANQRLNKFA
ncbi:MAG: formyltransferase family protein [Pyrinomonadaceae bacterium]